MHRTSFNQMTSHFRVLAKHLVLMGSADMNGTTANKKLWKSCSLYNSECAMVTSLQSRIYQDNYIVCLTCNIVLITVAIALNLLTIFTKWRSTRRGKNMSYFLIMLLSASTFCCSRWLFRLCARHGFNNNRETKLHDICPTWNINILCRWYAACNFKHRAISEHRLFDIQWHKNNKAPTIESHSIMCIFEENYSPDF